MNRSIQIFIESFPKLFTRTIGLLFIRTSWSLGPILPNHGLIRRVGDRSWGAPAPGAQHLSVLWNDSLGKIHRPVAGIRPDLPSDYMELLWIQQGVFTLLPGRSCRLPS